MLNLIIETAQERGLVALGTENQIIGQTFLPVGLTNSHTLFKVLDELLRSLNIQKKNLKLMIVGIGPGSYTGVRVAAATAGAFSYALQIPLVTVPTLSTFIPEKEGCFAALLDARVSGFYLQKGFKNQNQITYLCEPKTSSVENLHQELEAVDVLVMPNQEKLRPKIETVCPKTFHWEEKKPSGDQFLKLGMQKYRLGEFSKNLGAELLYLRPTQAEIEKKTKVAE